MSQNPSLDQSRQTSDAEKQHEVLPGTDVPLADIQEHKITPHQLLKHSHDGDIALEAFASYRDGAIIEIDEETNRRLLRKIDWNLMPV
jgi:ACS family allantoate permease-like MFS transporter